MAERGGPRAPSADNWSAAWLEYGRGIFVRLTFSTKRGDVAVAQTNTFLRARAAAPLTEMEKRALNLALVQIGRGLQHPCLNTRTVPLNPQAFMASPAPGVTITWCPHPEEPDLPVMLTLEVDRD